MTNALVEIDLHAEACTTHATRIAYLAELAVTNAPHTDNIPARISYHEACLRNLGLTQAEIYSWVHRVEQVPFIDA